MGQQSNHTLSAQDTVKYYDLMMKYMGALEKKDAFDRAEGDDTYIKGGPRDLANINALQTGLQVRGFYRDHAGPDGKVRLPNIPDASGDGPAIVQNPQRPDFVLQLDGGSAPTVDTILRSQGLRDPDLQQALPRTPVTGLHPRDPGNQHNGGCGSVRNYGAGSSTTVAGRSCP